MLIYILDKTRNEDLADLILGFNGAGIRLEGASSSYMESDDGRGLVGENGAGREMIDMERDFSAETSGTKEGKRQEESSDDREDAGQRRSGRGNQSARGTDSREAERLKETEPETDAGDESSSSSSSNESV